MNTELAEMVEKARLAGACESSLNKIKRFEGVADALASALGPFWAYWYAKRVVKRRWGRGEAAISKDAEWSYQYANRVVKRRWRRGEAAISKDAEWSYQYAKNVTGV